MADPARSAWWDDVVSVDSVKLNDFTHLLWGDRVRVIDQDGTMRKVSARGTTGWVSADSLGGEALLELYFIDVGQGDGILIVTPEGHHLMIDGGLPRSRQSAGKSAADFVDWKFHKDYLTLLDQGDAGLDVIRLDAMIASHADLDHYGGLQDLVDVDREAIENELDTLTTTVESFYHQGLCPQVGGTDDLGNKENGHFLSLLDDRTSAEDALADNPVSAPRIRGMWRDFVERITHQTTASGDETPIHRLSQQTGFLPGFAPQDGTEVQIRVLAPIQVDVNGTPGLLDIGNEGENKNGHSVVLRLDYKDRRVLLTGDLNDRSHRNIMAHYGDDFVDQWRVDVAKACHHGSHHVDYEFLRGVGAVSTVFSSGDANAYDHPRAWVLGAAALAGRVIEDPSRARLKAPLVYSTEIARSIGLSTIDQLREYSDQQEYGSETTSPIRTVSGNVTKSKWRVVLDRNENRGHSFPPVTSARVMEQLVYGLVNVRTDGHRVLLAVRNEANSTWSSEVLEGDEIDSAFQMVRPDVV